MASECDETIEVSDESTEIAAAAAPTPNNVDVGEQEMVTVVNTAYNADINENLKMTVHSTNTQEPSVLFVVKDVTETDWQKSRYSYSMPLSSAVTDLYSAIAKEAGSYNIVCNNPENQCVYSGRL